MHYSVLFLDPFQISIFVSVQTILWIKSQVFLIPLKYKMFFVANPNDGLHGSLQMRPTLYYSASFANQNILST